MNANCELNLPDSPINKAIIKKVGKDTLKVYAYLSEAIPNGIPTIDFEEWYTKNTGKRLDLTKLSGVKAADFIIQYYRHRHPNVSDTAKNIVGDDKVSTFGYESIADREEGKRHAANIGLQIFNRIQELGEEVKGDIAKYYLSQIRNNWNSNMIFTEIASITGKTVKEVKQEWQEADDKYEYVREGLGGDNMSSTNKSRFAVYQELNGSEKASRRYMQELLCNPILQDIYNQSRNNNENIFNDNVNDAVSEVGDKQLGADGQVESNDPIDSIGMMTNHIGAYGNYMSHISARIRNYFNSLPRFASPDKKNNKYVTDTNNHYGIAEMMDATECSSMLYGHTTIFRNVDTMIKGIEFIGRNVPGFESFVKFAEDLRLDPDFATEVFTVFAKTIISKLQVVTGNGSTVTRKSNQRANRQKTFVFNLMNDVRAMALENDSEHVKSKAESISKTVSDAISKENTRLNKNATKEQKKQLKSEVDTNLQQAKSEIVKLVRFYFPSVEVNALTSFIDLNGGGSVQAKVNNIKTLVDIVTSTADASVETKKSFDNLQLTIQENIAFNKALKEDMKSRWHDYAAESKPVTELYGSEYLSDKHISSINTLSDLLLPYSVVKLQLNSPNVEGNNSSDVINNSHLTNIIKMLDDTYVEYKEINGVKTKILRNPSLEQWGKAKARSKQYKYSSILFEQYDETGKPINKAIFRQVPKDSGNICLTEHAPQLLQIALFDGSTDMDSGSNIIYPNMTQPDYLPTSFMSYFHPSIDPTEDLTESDLANYFPRTPSDAPKTFCIRGPKYKTDDLITPADLTTLRSIAISIIDSIPRPTKEEYNENYKVDNPLKKSVNTIVEAITTHKPLFLEKGSAYKELEDGTTIAVLVDEKYNSGYIFKGYLESRGKAKQLVDYELIACTPGVRPDGNGKNVKDDDIPLEIKESLIGHYTEQLLVGPVTAFGNTYEQAKQTVNKNHPVFKILKNQFKQEMLDCAIALDEYFDLDDDGWVKDSGKEDSTEKIIKLKDDKDNNTGYQFYHLDDKGQVLGHKNGHYTLDGKAFHSDKFTLCEEDENGNVVLVNYLDELITTEPNDVYDFGNAVDDDDIGKTIDDGKIHILYGGYDADSFLHMTRDENGDVVDVYFTESQDAAIDEAISKFIISYNQQFQNTLPKYKNSIKGTNVGRLAITDYAMNNLVMHMAYNDLFEGNTKFYKNSQTILKRAKEYQGSGIPYGIVDYNDIETYYTPSDFDDALLDRKLDNDGKDVEFSLLNNLRKNGEIQYVNKENPNDTISVNKYRTLSEEDKSKYDVQNVDIFAGTILENIHQRKRFRAVTVKNSIMTNEKGLSVLKKALVKSLTPTMGKKRAELHAMDILYGPVVLDENGKVEKNPDGTDKRRGGFTETKVNDAQSYITFEEWVRRVAAKGQLKKYLPLIKRIINERYINKNDSNHIISKAEYNKLSPELQANYTIEPLSEEDLKEFIQVQKNFYYDMYYDERYGIYVPRQIKNAELVLIPRLIKGTQLETVYNLMNEAGVDQLNTVETSKAANEKVLTLWDNDGNLAGAETFAAEARQYRQVYDYKNLYTQQETPQHINSANKAGIQIMKKIIDNISPDDPLYERKLEYFRLVVQNIRESYNDLMDEINIIRDEEGNIQFNDDGSIKGFDKDGRQVFFDKLREEMLRLGLDENLIDYVTLDEFGQPKMPAVVNSVISKFESVVQSVFNSAITRQKLPGFHAAQVTNVGWQSMGEQVTGRQYSADLAYHPMEYAREGNEKDKISQREYDKLPAEVKKQYKQIGPAPYIEIMLPLSNFGIDRNSAYYKNMTDDQILEELKKQGLDIIMGYRIPTEGKQSVCNMRVVGFTPNALGSTIVVPNDWVSQTGSDFDIDSVYGIHFATKTRKNGKIERIKYIEKPSMASWFNYVTSYKDKELNDNTKGEIREVVKEAKAAYNSVISELNNQESNIYDNLHDKIKDIIRQTNAKVDQLLKNKAIGNDTKYAIRIQQVNIALTNIVKKYPNLPQQVKDDIEKFKTITNEVREVLLGNIEDLLEDSNSNTYKILESKKDEINNKISNTRLHTYEEYIASPVERINTRAARNNRLLQTMIDILGDPSSLEENLSRSNFDDIIYWRNKVMNDNVAAAREYRSPYNVLDQIAYQEDAMSGATLKGMSVALDTWCSVCNTAQSTLTEGINVVYDANDFDNPQEAMTRFNAGSYDGKKTFRINHTQYGWSNDNRNVSGKILTAYSSQTTAHILDAIKEGAIPNVNAYSFGVYKTLVNVGSDYKTAISFIMQPGIKRIIDNYNKNNSVFTSSYDNPIHQALKDIAKESGIRVDYSTPLPALMGALQSVYGETFNKLFKQSWHDKDLKISFNTENLQNLPLIVPMLYDRLKEQGIFDKNNENVEHIRNAFDLGCILIFHKLNKTAKSVGAIARCCNPDKFGAKQSVYATNKVFDDMHELLFDYTNSERELKPSVLTCTVKRNGKTEEVPILEAIYPGITDSKADRLNPAIGILTKDRAEESSYPTLYAFLKYASGTSTIIAQELFITQNPNFVSAIKGFANVLSNNRGIIDEETYNNLQKYALSYYYNLVPSMIYPLKYDKDTDTVDYKIKEELKDKDGNVVKDDNGNPVYITFNERDERARVYGFGHLPGLKYSETTREPMGNGKFKRVTRTYPFEVADINNPTSDEIENYLKLSPAQKVEFIKTNFDNSGIFNRLDISLHNGQNRGFRAGMQTIEYRENNTNSNVVYTEFSEAFYNSNPLVRLAAFDLIKYAVLVEGMNMTNTSIAKIIPNQTLLDDVEDDGTGFINNIMFNLKHIGTDASTITSKDSQYNMYENYLRSHPETKGIKFLNLSTKANKEKYNVEFVKYGLLKINIDESDNEDNQAKVQEKWREKMVKAGFLTYDESSKQYVANSYIRIKNAKDPFLYKIIPLKDNVTKEVISIIAYPLNPLEKNEVTDISAKDENNINYPDKSTFDTIIKRYLAENQQQELNASYIETQRKEMIAEGTWSWRSVSNQNNRDKNTVDFDLMKLALADNMGASIALDTIQDYFSNPLNTAPLYIQNNTIANYIKEAGARYASVQKITMPNAQQRKFSITKVNMLGYEKRYLGKDDSNNYIWSREEFDRRIENVKDEPIKKALISARNSNLGVKLSERNKKSSINNLFVVTPFIETQINTSGVYNSEFEEFPIDDAINIENQDNSLDKLVNDSIDFMTTRSSAGDETAMEQLSRLTYSGIDSTTLQGDELNAYNLRYISAFLQNKAQELKTKFENFIKDPSDPSKYISILDPSVQEQLIGNETLVNDFISLTNEAKAFVDRFLPYKAFNTTSNDPELKFHLDKIKEFYDIIAKLPINQANLAFANGYATKLTKNPLVKDQIIKVMDNFWQTYGAMWAFHDIAENGDPLLQTFLYDVMGDIDAKKKQFVDTLRTHRKKIDDILRRAKEKGVPINWDHIFSDDGTFIYDYTHDFIDDYTRLREARDEAARKFKRGSIEHLKAKLEYDQFKANHVNQPVLPQYYIDLCDLDRDMIENHSDIFSQYKKLQFEYTEILESIGELGYTSELKDKLQDVKDRMANIRFSNRFNADGTVNAEASVHIDALEDYMRKVNALNKTYFRYESEFGFDEQLDINLSIIRAEEKPDKYGNPTVSEVVLRMNDKYMAAKLWIQKNAFYSLEIKRDANGHPISIGAELEDARDRLYNKTEYGTLVFNKMHDIIFNKRKNDDISVYDEYGTIDATKFTKDELAAIKADQESRFRTHNMPAGTDIVLISNDNGKRNVQYKAEFYNNMRTDGYDNPTYFKTVTAINKILEKYYSEVDNKVHLERVPDTKEGIEDLKKLHALYVTLRGLRKTEDSTNGKAVKEFIEKEVEFVTDKEFYREQLKAVHGNVSDEFFNAWVKVNLSYDEDGNLELDEEGKNKLNPYLYSYMKPKDESKWIDEQKTRDLALINQHYRKVQTSYYLLTKEAMKRADEANPGNNIFKNWMVENHVYNPYTRQMEPLECWTRTELKEQYVGDLMLGEWMPINNQKHRVPNDGKMYRIVAGKRQEFYNKNKDFRNPNYKENATLQENYVIGSQKGKYDSNITLTDEEREMRDYLQQTLIDTTEHSISAKRFFEKGNLPIERLNDKTTGKEVAKAIGTVFGLNLNKTKDELPYQTQIGYDKDRIPPMPLTKILFDKKAGSQEFTDPEPKRADYLNTSNPEEEYRKAHDEWQAKRDRIKAENAEISKQLMNKDFLGVIERYLEKAAQYNAVQDNKQKLYYLLNMLRRQEAYIRDTKGWFGSQLRTSTKNGQKLFDKAVDDNLIKQYEVFLRRLLFDQWKDRDSKKVNAMNRLQNFTSANYMMLNFKGGLANVTLGLTGMYAESAAGEYFGRKTWGAATIEYGKGITGFARALYEETSYNKQDAVAKYFLVVDYNEITGVPRKQTMDKYVERFRNAMFSPQTAGEHFMQTSVLFAMLKSHRLVKIDDDALGIGYACMNKDEYLRYNQSKILDEVLTEQQKQAFERFKKEISSDVEQAKDYAWWRKDVITEFIALHCNKEQIKDYVKRRDAQEEKLSKEFDAMEDIYEQLKLGSDGRMDFVENSMLSKLNDEFLQDGKVSKAHALMGRFAERVRKVNNKIHGVYNKSGQAYVEKTWWGSLVMQYHKHLPTGLAKRYRARGFFSETRGSVEKGMLWSVIDFLTLNHRAVKHQLGLSDANVEAIEGVQNILKSAITYCQQLSLTWHLLPRHEKANIKRNLGDLTGTLSALALVIALMAIGDDDDDNDGYWYNFFMYEFDRLASESFMYNPLGLWTETKTLMSTPIAAQSIVSDVFSGAFNIASWLATGDVEDMKYKSGQFAGRNKLSVYFERRIPIWNGIRGILDLPNNNHYYKRGKKVITIVPAKDIAHFIHDSFE